MAEVRWMESSEVGWPYIIMPVGYVARYGHGYIHLEPVIEGFKFVYVISHSSISFHCGF